MDENMNMPDKENNKQNNDWNKNNDRQNNGWIRDDDQHYGTNRDSDSVVYPQGRYQQQVSYSQNNYNERSQRYQQPTYPAYHNNRNENNQSSRGAKIAGFVALFLAVSVLMSSITGITVFKIMDNRSPVPISTDASPTEPASNDKATEPEQEADVPEGTDKHFSIEEAARRQDNERTALSTMEIAALGRPAVVAISTETTMTDMFGRTGPVEAAGSGFIITEDGYIVTNYHVVNSAETITVTMESGEVSDAIMVGFDEMNDIAVLKVDGDNLPTVDFGISDDLQIGELAVAIGNPLGRLSGTVTAGIISALNRTITIDGQTLTLLQTDAAINSGNSGGALFNSYGEVIGINTAKNAGSGVEGLGFAIPIDNAKPVIESLIRYGYVRGRTKIGITTRDVTAQMAHYYQLPEGVFVVEIDRDGPAYAAGVRQGDIIIAVDGEEITTASELLNLRNRKDPGDILALTVVRNNEEREFDVVLEEDMPEEVTPSAS